MVNEYTLVKRVSTTDFGGWVMTRFYSNECVLQLALNLYPATNSLCGLLQRHFRLSSDPLSAKRREQFVRERPWVPAMKVALDNIYPGSTIAFFAFKGSTSARYSVLTYLTICFGGFLPDQLYMLLVSTHTSVYPLA
jgi:hypothetical protein